MANSTSNALPIVSTANVHDVPYQTSFFVSDEIITTFIGPKSASNFGLATATTATNVANCNGRYFLLDPTVHVHKPPQNSLVPEKLDKSIIEHMAVRDLLENYYFPVIHPRCPVVDPSQVVLDTHLRRLPIKRRFFVVMVVAIAAAHQGRTYPEIYTSALILRHWADELLDAVLMEHDGDSLQALLLLIVYELVDPSRKLIWTLLGVACRMCVKLGWHRSSETEYDARLINDHHQAEGDSQLYPLPWRRRMFHILYQWERYVCGALCSISHNAYDFPEQSATRLAGPQFYRMISYPPPLSTNISMFCRFDLSSIKKSANHHCTTALSHLNLWHLCMRILTPPKTTMRLGCHYTPSHDIFVTNAWEMGGGRTN